TDRTYVKVFEEETNLIANILLDKSGSMGFPEGGVTKLDYGAMLAASLAYLMIRQQDAVGLCLFDETVRELVPHRSVRKQLFHMLHTLDGITPGAKTSISPALHELAERMNRRGLVVLISDLMDDPEKVLMGLKHFRHRQHEVVVFHILDPREMDMDYRESVEFEDMETGRKLRVEPAFLREQFRRDIGAWIDKLERGCRNHAIDYHLLRTDTPFDKALTAFLGKRERMG
ncbi:MAG TPA: VWA domain-containing protein, partial [Candidatus Krumholzibacteria bacterium]|nr:VWA domain-containing protein [Candidatus Krumholzibacteria bacterium]